jgi:hypothetical protein
MKLDIPIKDLLVNVVATGAAIAFGTAQIAGLPQGHLMFLGAMARVEVAGPGASGDLSDTWAGDFGVGTTPVDDATITAGDDDIVPSTALAAATAEVSPFTSGVSTASEAPAIIDNTAGLLELNLNILVDAADIVDDTNVDLLVDGVLHIAYIVIGDD